MAELHIPTLETERLIVRPLALDDLADCHRLYVDIDLADKDASDAEKLAQRRQWLDWTVREGPFQSGELAVDTAVRGTFALPLPYVRTNAIRRDIDRATQSEELAQRADR